MRRKTALRILAALGKEPFEPTEDQRHLVSVLVFNGTPEARIAAGLGLDVLELRYWFAHELGYAQDRILAQSAAAMIELARQRQDLGVAFRANALMLQSRLPVWRDSNTEGAEPTRAPVGVLTLEEVTKALAELETQ